MNFRQRNKNKESSFIASLRRTGTKKIISGVCVCAGLDYPPPSMFPLFTCNIYTTYLYTSNKNPPHH